jgi:hypothetical protein
MLNVIYAECLKQAQYSECLYAGCRYAKCRGAAISLGTPFFFNVLSTSIIVKRVSWFKSSFLLRIQIKYTNEY